MIFILEKELQEKFLQICIDQSIDPEIGLDNLVRDFIEKIETQTADEILRILYPSS